jgi:hypothetical protein
VRQEEVRGGQIDVEGQGTRRGEMGVRGEEMGGEGSRGEEARWDGIEMRRDGIHVRGRLLHLFDLRGDALILALHPFLLGGRTSEGRQLT